MPRKFNSSKLRSDLRRIERKQREAINKFNRAVDAYNREVRAQLACAQEPAAAHY
jgi:hypothetical protein